MKKGNEIVNWSNDLTDLPFKNFTANEVDIFLAICYRCQRQGTRTIKITFDKLRELSYFSAKNNERFQDRVLTVNQITFFEFGNRIFHAPISS